MCSSQPFLENLCRGPPQTRVSEQSCYFCVVWGWVGWDGGCQARRGHSPLLSNRWRLLLLLLQCLAWTVSMVTHPQEHVWPEKKVGLLGLWIMMRLCFFYFFIIFIFFFLFSPTQQTAMIQWRQLNCFIKQFCKWMFHTIITGGPTSTGNWAWGLEPVFIYLVDWTSKVSDIPSTITLSYFIRRMLLVSLLTDALRCAFDAATHVFVHSCSLMLLHGIRWVNTQLFMQLSPSAGFILIGLAAAYDTNFLYNCICPFHKGKKQETNLLVMYFTFAKW